METVDDSLVEILLQNDLELDIFSTNTALEGVPIGRRHAGEQVTVDFTFRVPLKDGRYSVAATASHSGSRDSELDLSGATAAFDVSRPAGEDASSGGLVHLPTRVEVFEPDKVLKHKPLR
jgi:hypothetical protein